MTTVTEIQTYGYETPREFSDTIASLKKNKSIKGVGYPFTNRDGLGLFNKASDRALLKSMVYQFINTQTGERPMLPNYGIDLNQFLFEPLDEQLHSDIVEEVYTSVVTNHPEWEILKLSVLQSDDTLSYKGIPGIVIILNIRLRGDETSSIEVQTTI
tara:strand:+ start:1272 stop:1742 length:471 start_codon:yes stop_codon:yes gene_type:complete